MISRLTSSIPKEDVVFPRLLYCDLRCSQTCWQRSEACCWHSQASRQRSQVLTGARNVLSGALRSFQTYPNLSCGTPWPVFRDRSCTGGRPECPPTVWYSAENDTSKFTLHILSGTPGGSRWLKCVLLMYVYSISSHTLLEASNY